MKTRPPCPVCIRRLPIDIDLPTHEEMRAAIVLVCERNAERALPMDERRALETIRSLLMEEQP
jgi:hypothetical protein